MLSLGRFSGRNLWGWSDECSGNFRCCARFCIGYFVYFSDLGGLPILEALVRKTRMTKSAYHTDGEKVVFINPLFEYEETLRLRRYRKAAWICTFISLAGMVVALLPLFGVI